MPVHVPPAVVQLSPPSHSEYDNLRVAASSAHLRMCGDACASAVSMRGPMRSYLLLSRPSVEVPTAVAGPLTIRDWLIRGAKVAASPDLTASPPHSDAGLVVHTGTLPHANICMHEPWSDLIGSSPVLANG